MLKAILWTVGLAVTCLAVFSIWFSIANVPFPQPTNVETPIPEQHLKPSSQAIREAPYEPNYPYGSQADAIDGQSAEDAYEDDYTYRAPYEEEGND
jgi:hypothetical protein